MLKALVTWRDLTDGHLYNAGDPFPWDGREVPEERIYALKSSQNKAGFALIKAVESKKAETPIKETKTAGKPAETPENEPVKEQAKKPGRKAKKAE